MASLLKTDGQEDFPAILLHAGPPDGAAHPNIAADTPSTIALLSTPHLDISSTAGEQCSARTPWLGRSI